MIRYRVVIAAVLALAISLTTCNLNVPTTETMSIPETKISECDAIKIAKGEVPTRIAESYTNSGFRQELGPHGTWFVNFANVNTTPGEMGWVENENTHYIPTSYEWEENSPGIYRNVVIFVAAGTGNITERELNNGIILGPPGAKCN